jgi:WXG100 family type VII secretion target
MSEGVLWSIPAMQQGQDDIQNVQRSLMGLFEDMNARLQPMQEFWQGKGNEGYAAVQARWNQARDDMMTVLQQIYSALGEAVSLHEGTEQSIVNAWGGD